MCEPFATEILQLGLKDSGAQLTQLQLQVVKHIFEDQRNVLYIDKTGAGKSETYFVLTKLLRNKDAFAGPVIVVTPMVALIHDQVRRATAFGLNAYAYYSAKGGMTGMQRSIIYTSLGKNKVDLLFMTAEMLNEISSDSQSFDGGRIYTPQLLTAAPPLMRHPPNLAGLKWSFIPMLVIDEIHYIAEAGHDFRVDYARVWAKLACHPWFVRAQKLGLTATVTQRVRLSLESALPQLRDWQVVLGSLYRDNINLRILPKPANDAARLDYVFQLFQQNQESYILVFCKTILKAIEYSKELVNRGVSKDLVGYYYSAKGDAEVLDNEKKFRNGNIHVLFSTCALGLGYDKSDISHVVHMWTPNSLVQFYQEIGRAGRTNSGEHAVAHMLPTTPWNPTGWVPVLSDICWYLAKLPSESALESVIKAREADRKHKDSAVKQAIDLGIEKGMLERQGELLHLLAAQNSTQAVDKLFADSVKDEVLMMCHLAHNCGKDNQCLWRFMLSHFEGQHNPNLNCGRCSGMQCSPGNDIAPNSQAQGNVFYKITTPVSNVDILALNLYGESLEIDEERVKEILYDQRPSMVAEPAAKWTICPLPDSAGENVTNAKLIASMLDNVEVSTFISKNPLEKRKVMGASVLKRKEILSNKFTFNWECLPKVGNVLLYDNVVSSGDTIDAVVAAMRVHLNGMPMELVALVLFAYSSAPNLVKLKAGVK